MSYVNRSIAILIPTKNEQSSIVDVIEDIPYIDLFTAKYDVKVILVDSSIDLTPELAIEAGATVIRCRALGKGYAVRTAFELLQSYQYIFMIDADMTYPAYRIVHMLHFLEHGYDVVIGSRLQGKIVDDAMTWINIIGNKILTIIANVLYKTKTTDLCTGLWGFNNRAIYNMHLTANGFDIEANMFTEINRLGLRLKYIPISYFRRSGIAKLKVPDGLIIAKRLITEKLNRSNNIHKLENNSEKT
jgi:glycosyltransferase involved in cell wall biosynthesis